MTWDPPKSDSLARSGTINEIKSLIEHAQRLESALESELRARIADLDIARAEIAKLRALREDDLLNVRQCDETLRGAIAFEVTGARDPIPELRWSTENVALAVMRLEREVADWKVRAVVAEAQIAGHACTFDDYTRADAAKKREREQLSPKEAAPPAAKGPNE